MAAVVSFAGHLASMGAQAGGFRRDVADVARLELDNANANALRYLLCDWERAAGVRSNFGAQAERLAAGIFREALHGVHAERKRARERGGIRLALDERQFHVRKIPLANRGWPGETARPSKASGGGYPMRTVQIPGDKNGADWARAPCLVTVASTEEWAMLPAVVRGWDGPVVRRHVVRMYRAIAALERRSPTGPRLVVALNLRYGQRDPAANYALFGDLAPLVHLTEVAHDLAGKATRELHRERAAVRGRAVDDRETVDVREAVAAGIKRLQGPERRALVGQLERAARALLARASNAILRELEQVP